MLTLSAGLRSRDAVVQIAKPLLSAFTAAHKWPVSIATLDGDAMRVRASTVQESPFATEADRRRLARRAETGAGLDVATLRGLARKR